MRRTRHECVMDCTGDDIFIVFDGMKIAKRGYPGTPQAMTWVSLEPGWQVLDGPRQHCSRVRGSAGSMSRMTLGKAIESATNTRRDGAAPDPGHPCASATARACHARDSRTGLGEKIILDLCRDNLTMAHATLGAIYLANTAVE